MMWTRMLVVSAAVSGVMACGANAPARKVGGTAGVSAAGDASGAGGDAVIGTMGGAGTGGAAAGASGTIAGTGGSDKDGGADAFDGRSADARSPSDGASDAAPTCGGNLLGAWDVIDEQAPPGPPASVGSCLDLKLGRSSDGTLSASTWYPSRPAYRELGIVFSSTSYAATEVRRGPVTVSYSAACLASASGGAPPTCEHLADALAAFGRSTGDFNDGFCAAPAAGGCECTMTLRFFGGRTGSWSASGDKVYLQAAPGNPAVETTFCSDAGGLRFGSSLDLLLSGWSAFTFTPDDCADGEQSVLEEGTDCGKVCGKACR